MKHSRWQVFGALAVLIFAFMLSRGLYRANVNSPRISLTELTDLKEIPEGGPFLLEGGKITEDADGETVFLLSFHYAGDGCLYFPYADSAVINGRQSAERMYRGYVAKLRADMSNGGDYSVKITGDRTYLPTNRSVYLGSERQISDFISGFFPWQLLPFQSPAGSADLDAGVLVPE